MRKAVLISIRPKWCQKIASGEKAIEVRKTKPKLETPFKCYIYCTQDKHLAFMQNQTGTNLIACMDATAAIPVGGAIGNGKVIGEFTCDKVDWITRIGFSGSPVPSRYSICNHNNMDVLPIDDLLRAAHLTYPELADYLAGGEGYGWHISGLRIYDTPKELSEFTGLRTFKGGFELRKIDRPPQSWCYVEDVNS